MTKSSKRIITADNYFAIIPEWVLYAPITSHAKVVYCALCRYADSNGYCFPSRSTLAERLGLNVKMIDRAMSELKDYGAIRVKHRKNDNGGWSSNLYKVYRNGPATFERDDDEDDLRNVDVVLDLETQVSIGRVPNVHSPSVPDVQLNRAITNESQESYISHAISDEITFDEFWAVYPRKVNKGQARRIWNRVVREHDPTVIVDAAKRYAESRTGQDPKFTAHASTWLNGERWTDEPDPDFKPKGNRRDEFDAMFYDAVEGYHGENALGFERKELGS